MISTQFIELVKRFIIMEQEVVLLKLQIKFLKNGKDCNTGPSYDIGILNAKSLRVNGPNKAKGKKGIKGIRFQLAQILVQ